jgi:hypothetical protein
MLLIGCVIHSSSMGMFDEDETADQEEESILGMYDHSLSGALAPQSQEHDVTPIATLALQSRKQPSEYESKLQRGALNYFSDDFEST